MFKLKILLLLALCQKILFHITQSLFWCLLSLTKDWIVQGHTECLQMQNSLCYCLCVFSGLEGTWWEKKVKVQKLKAMGYIVAWHLKDWLMWHKLLVTISITEWTDPQEIKPCCGMLTSVLHPVLPQFTYKFRWG